jgi:hypothetical protein
MQNNFESLDIFENLQMHEILRLGHQNGMIKKEMVKIIYHIGHCISVGDDGIRTASVR